MVAGPRIAEALEGCMSKTEIIVTAVIDRSAEQVIADGLHAFNDDVTGYGDRAPLAVLVRDAATGEVLGGALGRSSLGLLFLELFHLPKSLRGQGLGSAVLQAFEAEGARRGCRSAVLYTISFQAPEFYERHGWRRFGDVPCDPPGTSRVFMMKELKAVSLQP
jgi:GNAT superfamily N-acetyltransferase